MDDILGQVKEEVIDNLAKQVMDEFESSKATYREYKEDICCRAHENIKGVYGPTVKISGTSKAFAGLTRPRVMHVVARIMEVIAPVGEDVVTYESTPLPRMPELEATLRASGLPEEDILKMVKEAADAAAANLQIKSKDDLEETRWKKSLLDFTYNYVAYGTGIMHGPMAVPVDSNKLTAMRGLAEQQEEVRPEFMSKSPLSIYPAPGATDIEDCPWLIDRTVVSKSMLRDWSKNETLFNIEKVKEILDNNVDGDWQPEEWEKRILDANKGEKTGPCGKFTVYIRWGLLSGEDLKDAGHDIPDEELNSQVMAQVWVCCNKVISIRPSKLFRDRLPFYVASYSPVDFSIFGCGVPESMFSSQDAYNACERAKYDNLAASHAPYSEVNVSRLVDPKDVEKIGPKCVIRTRDDIGGTGNNRPAVEYKIIPNITQQLEAAQQNILNLIQQQTDIPNVLMATGGEGVHNRTSSGAAMQYNSAITPLKGVIMRLEEDVIVPSMQKLKEFYDMFSKDETIKGDSKVVARGVSGLVAREALLSKMEAFLARAAQVPEWAKQIDMGRYGTLLMQNFGLGYARLTYTQQEAEENARKAEEANAQAEIMKAQGMADVETGAQKQRAETSPSDMLLQVASEAPEGSPTWAIASKEALRMKGILSPELEEALNVAAQTYVVKSGVEVAKSIHGDK